jgi:chromosome condensin MukBEF ATPase and DNA-binding subunit MukB
MQQANTELNDARLEENLIKVVFEQNETKLLELNNKRTDIKKDLNNMERDLIQYKSQIDTTKKFCVNSRRTHILLQKKLQEKKAEYNTIFKECKVYKL